jgi:hypothetical protein
MIMIRNGAQVYIMMLSSNRQPGGVLGVNPSRPAAPEALANNYHMSSGTPAERRRLVGEASAIRSLVPSISPPLDTKGDKCLLLLRGVWKTI